MGMAYVEQKDETDRKALIRDFMNMSYLAVLERWRLTPHELDARLRQAIRNAPSKGTSK